VPTELDEAIGAAYAAAVATAVCQMLDSDPSVAAQSATASIMARGGLGWLQLATASPMMIATSATAATTANASAALAKPGRSPP
jgi:hypothetical protein